MKKILSLLLIVSSFVLRAQDDSRHYVKVTNYDLNALNLNEDSGIVTYEDFTVTVTPSDMFTCTGGSSAPSQQNLVLSITNSVLSISGALTTATGCSLKTGPIKHLNTIPMLPNMDLGPILTTTGQPSGLNLKIISGWLYVFNPSYLTEVSCTLTATFTGTAVNYPATSILPYVCNPAGAGANGSTIKIIGNEIQLYLSAGWSTTCNLNGNYSFYLNTSSPIPDTELGTITSTGSNTIFKAKIYQNSLVIYTSGSVITSPNNVKILPQTYPINTVNTAVVSESVTYFDETAKTTQQLSYKRGTNRVWAKELAYDNYSRIEKESYAVPLISNVGFNYTNLLGVSNSRLYKYFSDQNTDEPYQANATRPYTQINYDDLNPGGIINATGGNMINNEWKTGYSFTVPAAQEMYYLYGTNYFDGPIESLGEIAITQFYKTITVDENGVENVSFTDQEGKLLATAKSGGASSYPVLSLIGVQGYVDVHIPAGILSSQITLIGGATNYIIYNLKTGGGVTSLSSGNTYRIVSKSPPPTTAPKVYMVGGSVSHDTNDSTIRGIYYRVNYYDYSLNIYNKAGQLIKSVQPKGTSLSVPTASPGHMNSNYKSYTTNYTYDTLNNVSTISNIDEGTTTLLYRKDGQVRYSKDSEQSGAKVSYVEYDTFGRPIESGVIATTIAWESLNPDATLTAGTRTERKFIVYDYVTNYPAGQPVLPTLSSVLTTAGMPPATVNLYKQRNLDGTLAVSYSSNDGTNISAITWYSYDSYGVLEWVVEWNADLGAKTIKYRYDAYGNVKNVLYNDWNSADSFVHQYTYNTGNQLTKVDTGISTSSLTTQAEYFYYLTGELKRKSLAGGVQGVDYVYTLGGAIKSINAPSLTSADDPGHDNNDLWGMTIDYYQGDYVRSNTAINTSQTVSGSNIDQYNGNIKATRFANKSLDYSSGVTTPKAYIYKYDRNNWLTSANYGTTSTSAGTTTVSLASGYKETGITYDANGNITALQRNNSAGSYYDRLIYNYTTGANKLWYVTDSAGATTSITDDIEPQAAGNYVYYLTGQLKDNVSEDLHYTYNADGLTAEVKKGTNTIVKFYYNERGQRIKKEMFSTASPFTLISTDYYVPDIDGNIIALYSKPASASIAIKENPISGVDRIGVVYRGSGGSIAGTSYQITDHIGNIRAVFTKTGSTATMDSYADYYPFGEKLKERSIFTNYRYAFQGQELDAETGMEAFELRLWDGRLGRWQCPDPYGQYFSPYLGMGNNPISGIDRDGGYANPIFDFLGNFRGVDSRGWDGEAILYDGAFFFGMSQEYVLNNGGVLASEYYNYEKYYYPDLNSFKNDPIRKKIQNFVTSIPNRPDYDGLVTWDEADEWARNGGGQPLYIDVGKLDLGNLKMTDFRRSKVLYLNFANPLQLERMVYSTGTVYGTLRLKLLDNSGRLKIGKDNGVVDTYDFNLDGRTLRDQLTKLGEWKATVGKRYNITPFEFIGYGEAYVPGYRPKDRNPHY